MGSCSSANKRPNPPYCRTLVLCDPTDQSFLFIMAGSDQPPPPLTPTITGSIHAVLQDIRHECDTNECVYNLNRECVEPVYDIVFHTKRNEFPTLFVSDFKEKLEAFGYAMIILFVADSS